MTSPKISIYTPTHDSRFLRDAYDSIKDQDFYEWIVVYNNGAEVIEFDDDRVKTFIMKISVDWVGPIKAYACSKATGDILLELDHDDILASDAIAKVHAAFADPRIGFVYSNTVGMDADQKPIGRYDESLGWKYRPCTWDGIELEECLSFPATPASVSRIWFAPNHLRAFRRSVYEAVGGYNTKMRVLDDQDLMCRMYLETEFHHIEEPLYLYRVHGENTWLKHNDEIQWNVMPIYDRYIESLAERWAELNGAWKIELGGRMYAKPGYKTVDLKDADIIADLNDVWPFFDSTAGVIRAFDVFEHLRDPLHTMKELYRVLAPGGWAFIQVPSTDGRGAFADPTHVSFWNESSFSYYTNQDKARFIDSPVRFQATQLYTTDKNEDGICWTVAHLISLKDGYTPPGRIAI